MDAWLVVLGRQRRLNHPLRFPKRPPEWSLSLRRGQRLERRLVRVRGHRVHDRRDDGGCGQVIRNCSGKSVEARVVLETADLDMSDPGTAALRTSVLQKRTGLGGRAWLLPPAKPRLRSRALCRLSLVWRRCWLLALVRRRNRLAAMAEELAYRRVLRASFCGASSARASICACRVFNTEESAGAIGQPDGNHNR